MARNRSTRRRFLFALAAAFAIAAQGSPAAGADKATDWNRAVELARTAFLLRAGPPAPAGPQRRRQLDAISSAFTRAATAHHAYIMNYVDTQGQASGARVKSYFVLGLYLEYAFNYWRANHWYQKAARDLVDLRRRGLPPPRYQSSRSDSISDLLPQRLRLTARRMTVVPHSEEPAVRMRRLSVVISKGPGETRTVLDELAALRIAPSSDFYATAANPPLDQPIIEPPE